MQTIAREQLILQTKNINPAQKGRVVFDFRNKNEIVLGYNQQDIIERLSESTTTSGLIDGSWIIDETLDAEIKLTERTITAEKIKLGELTGDLIALGTITETLIADDSISTPKLQANSIIASKIGAGEINALHLVSDSAVITGTAQIQDAIIIDAKISDLSVAKLTTGTISSQNITLGGTGWIRSSNYVASTSGFTINSAGNAEFNSVTVRGTVYVTGGDAFNKTYDNLDDIANGSTYSRVLATSISAGRIIMSQVTGNANDITEGLTNKFAAESGADITGNHTSNDTSNVNGETATNIKTRATRASNALNSNNRYKQRLSSSDITATGTNPSNGIVIDTTGLRGYSSSTMMFEISTSGDAFFQGELGSVGLTSTGYLLLDNLQTYPEKIKIFIDTGVPKIEFTDDGNIVGSLIGEYNTEVVIGGISFFMTAIKTTVDLIVGRDLIVSDDLGVVDDCYIGDNLYVDGNISTASTSYVRFAKSIAPMSSASLTLGALSAGWEFIRLNGPNSKIGWIADGARLYSDTGHLYYYDGSTTHTIV